MILSYSVLICPLQPSTQVSPPCLWHQMHHHHDLTSHHGTAHHRATRNPFRVCTLAASHLHKPGWALSSKLHRKNSFEDEFWNSTCSSITMSQTLSSEAFLNRTLSTLLVVTLTAKWNTSVRWKTNPNTAAETVAVHLTIKMNSNEPPSCFAGFSSHFHLWCS